LEGCTRNSGVTASIPRHAKTVEEFLAVAGVDIFFFLFKPLNNLLHSSSSTCK